MMTNIAPARETGGEYRAGTVAIAGRPNVGKSTLLNTLMGIKVSIVSPRPQTTRNRIAGVKTGTTAQFVFLDTPGIHQARKPLNRRLVAVARRAVSEADVVMLVVDARGGIGGEDRDVAALLGETGIAVVTALNKIDLIRRSALLPMMEIMAALLPETETVPVSALTGDNADELLEAIRRRLPVGPPLVRDGRLTEQTDGFFAQEVIREKVFRLTRAEVPYAAAVVVEEIEERQRTEREPILYIRASVMTTRASHKAIVIGQRAKLIKEIGSLARQELEGFFGKRVFLDLYVKVEKWDQSPVRLRDLGL